MVCNFFKWSLYIHSHLTENIFKAAYNDIKTTQHKSETEKRHQLHYFTSARMNLFVFQIVECAYQNA